MKLADLRKAREAGVPLDKLGSRPAANIGTAFGQGKEPKPHRRNTPRRHPTNRAFIEFALAEAADSRDARMRMMERLRELEWKWDRTPTLELGAQLKELRDAISEVEQLIVVQTALGRASSTLRAISEVGTRKEDH